MSPAPAAGGHDPRDLPLGQQGQNYSGSPAVAAGQATFTASAEQPQDSFSLDGTWDVDFQAATAVSDDARIQLAYQGTDVFVILGGEGTATATVRNTDGTTQTHDIAVTGNPTLYPILEGESATTGTVYLRLSPGLQAFTFTFG